VSSVPLVDLLEQHRQIADEVEEGFARVIAGASFILGKDVESFEDAFARFCGVSHCVGVASGTDALELALRGLGVGPGDEVILPTNTFIATALAVVRAGAVPVLVDCDPEFHLIDVDQVESRLGARTRAILPVHLYGQMAPMERLQELAKRSGVILIEDAAQAQGAARHGRAAGSVGDAAGTSFYPGKNLGAYGDAGAVLTNDDELARRVRALRSYGSDRRYHHPERGFNSRLDTLQAVVLNAKLHHLERWNRERREAARRYDELLADVEGVGLPSVAPGNEHVWHLYVVRVDQRDAVLAKLNEQGIGAAIHYPTPIHRTGAFASLGMGEGSFPVAERLGGEILSLPLFPGIRADQQARVVEALVRARA
jgi:dTDP-4-amino-4,6-dideoxygalactose transaminase